MGLYRHIAPTASFRTCKQVAVIAICVISLVLYSSFGFRARDYSSNLSSIAADFMNNIMDENECERLKTKAGSLADDIEGMLQRLIRHCYAFPTIGIIAIFSTSSEQCPNSSTTLPLTRYNPLPIKGESQIQLEEDLLRYTERHSYTRC